MKKKIKDVDDFLFEHMHTDFLPSGLITTIDEAIRRAKEYGDLTQLAIFMEKAPEEVTGNPEASKLIADALNGELPGRRGKPDIEQLTKEIRNYHVLRLLYFLKGYGFPIWYLSKKSDHEDACDIASRYVNRCGFAMISAVSIYKHVWLKHKKKGYMEKNTGIFNLSFERGRIEKKYH